VVYLNLEKTVTSLLAGVGLIGLALGFAFQDTASNFISGVFLSARRPFQFGDIVKTTDYFGRVKHLNLRNTIIETFKGQEILIPNKDVFQNPIENFTKKGLRLVDASCGVSYGDDLELSRKIAIEAVVKLDSIRDKENISLLFNEFSDSSINFNIRFWIKFGETNSTFLHAQSEAIIAIKKAFGKNDIDIPFPTRTLDFGIKGGDYISEAISGKDFTGILQ
jgi:small conductance mechanosensitive channel